MERRKIGTSKESWFTLKDGLRMYEKVWTPDSLPRAYLALMHGFSDRADRWNNWITQVVSEYPIQAIAFDRRGWGKTVQEKKNRGLTGKTTQVLTDLNEYLEHIASTIPDIKATPLFLMGLSLGGQESLYYSLSTLVSSKFQRPQISGLILEAPYVGLDPATKVNKFVVVAGKVAARVVPKRQMLLKGDPKLVSRNEAESIKWKEDPLCHDTGTLQGLGDMLLRARELTQLADPSKPIPPSLVAKLPYPVLWTHGNADKVTSYTISKQLFDRLEPYGGDPTLKTFKTYEGGYHELHSEPDGRPEQFVKDVGGWIIAEVDRRAAVQA